VGDALGATLEFNPPGTFEPIEDMIGGGAFNLQPGQWTDDTSMGLCLADSLIEKQGFDPVDQLRRYVRWVEEGYLSSKEAAFGMGGTVWDSWSGSNKPENRIVGWMTLIPPVTAASCGWLPC
jgi:ADP-ribosyl-[dinitrogen reductase] hydrolase